MAVRNELHGMPDLLPRPRLLPGDPTKDWPPRPLIDIGPIDPDKLWVGATDLI